jgi:competence protein ComEA
MERDRMNTSKKILVCFTLLLAVVFISQPAIAIQKININTASVSELVMIKGIGNKTAQKIIDYREKKKFDKVEDIINVKGVGEKLFNKINSQLTVGQKKKK